MNAPFGVLAWLDSLHVTNEDGAITNRKWPEAQAALDVLTDLVGEAKTAAAILHNVISAKQIGDGYQQNLDDLTAAIARVEAAR